ncbi:SusC/RagA family TonB-linked outer membrane protein [Rhizosphaericola mali]|uniref:SusC/RagA family TonB-linked outer membrane protein n=1 Tax=Rhizosphaericola mali TaxID=2545455 RepID=A0A5P2G9K1_9BACT|nr:SusC/RagA family TonB-linked outer membrane protein [Rhizosphaericola mali]QES90400.1 SusC/RagA family TonB-linked outer membrane protein [Rhizosphaericola mali]
MKRVRLFSLLSFPLLCLSIHASAQKDSIVGKIYNSKDSSALSGVTVRLPALNEDFTSDENGQFKIPANQNIAGKKLQFALVGFTNKEITLGAGDFSVYLAPLGADLNEVVVIGYGTSKKKDLTGSVTTISAKDFNKGLVATPEQLIQGKAAGVQITLNSGQPGAGSTVRIRGGASLSATNDPLYVIDGVPMTTGSIGNVANPLATINPNDIETFTVLKDANATAIYGSRASNGVILITTKKGKSGKPVYNFSSTNSLSKAAKLVDVMSGDQMRDYINEYGDDAHKALLGTANTNWQKEIYRTAFSTDNNFSVAGNIHKWLPIRFSAGYLNQSGILKRDNMQRISTALNLSPKFFDNHLSVNLNLKGSLTKSFFANQGAIAAAIQFDPTQPVYDKTNPYGGYFEWMNADGTIKSLAGRNPVSLLNMQNNTGQAVRSIGNLQLDYKVHFLPDLHVNVNAGYDITRSNGKKLIFADASEAFSTDGNSSRSRNVYDNYTLEAFLSYNKDLGKSNINAVAGYGYYTFSTKTNNYNTYEADDTTILTHPTYPLSIDQNRMLSYYARLIYTYDNKYILSGTVRRDGSSRFAPDNRYGYFPSVGLTWRAIEENFMEPAKKWLSDLKLRLSYGLTGQQDIGSSYSYQNTYYGSQSTGEYQIGDSYYSYYSPNAYNKNLKWEKSLTTNIGLDLGFLNNLITVTADYYWKNTSDLLGNIPVSVGSNFSNYLYANVGKMKNQGLELNISADVIRKRDINWTVSFNYSKYNTTISQLNNNDPSYSVTVGSIAGGTGNMIQRWAVGYTPYVFNVYQQVYDKSGKPVEGAYVDRNKDGVINSNDMYYYKSPQAKSTFGFSTNFGYKNWTLATTIRANVGNYMYDNVRSNFDNWANVNNTTTDAINNATVDLLNTNFHTPQYFSDYYVYNASFIRMDNLSLGYNFQDISKKHPDMNLTVSGTVQNVFLITHYPGLDPESNSSAGIDYNLYPRPRVYALSLNLKF